MAGAKKGRGRSAAAKKKNTSVEGAWARLTGPAMRRVGVGMGAALMVGAAGWGVLFGLGELEARAGALLAPEGPIVVAFDWPPAAGEGDADGATAGEASWLPASERRRLEMIVERAFGGEPGALTGVPLARAGRDLMATGWFEGPPSVRREPDGRIGVEGAWRVPAGVVQMRDAAYLVSRDARLLPLVYAPGTRAGRLPTLVGVRVQPPTRSDGALAHGEPWAPDLVDAGLALADLLRAETFAEQVRAIDLSRINDAGEGRIELITQRGGRVVWGGRPGVFRPGEQPDATRLERLRLIDQRYNSIDAGRDRLEIFGERVVIDQLGPTPARTPSP